MNSISRADGTLRVLRTHFWNSETSKGYCGQGKNFSHDWTAVNCGRCQRMYRGQVLGLHGPWPRYKKLEVCSKCGQDILGTGGKMPINFSCICRECGAEISVVLDPSDAGVVCSVVCAHCGHFCGELVFGESDHLNWVEVEAVEDRSEFKNGHSR